MRGAPSAAQRLRHSAEAVTVVDTRKAQQESADLGEVLARTAGVAVRRGAGLGSSTRFSLNGLDGDQIRFFVDGLPLGVAGYSAGVANIPVNLVERIEIYRGVVPIRFGADALGGALNLVTSERPGSQAAVSYLVGSFGTHRLTAAARYADARTGLFASARGFFDLARNDYPVDVQVPDTQGRLHDATVPRFHDGYRAWGAIVEGGVTGRSWAERLTLRGFYSGYDKELQSNAVMTVPYGEVTYGERAGGVSAVYRRPLPHGFAIDLVASYARRQITFRDESDWVYDWYGQHTVMRSVGGEIDGHPYDNIYWQNDVYARALVSARLPRRSQLRLSVSPTFSDRVGRNFTINDPTSRDPLSARRTRLTVVSGLEWQLDAFDDRLQNIAFVKSYAFHSDYENVLPGNIFQPLSRTSHSFGGGDALRLRATRWLWLKASYEYATRLPSVDELFGDGVLVGANLALEPEVSHNANLGPRVELERTRAGDFAVDVNAFLRYSQNLIVILGNEQFLTYQNVYTARSTGIEGSLAWTSPRRWVTVDGSVTFQDVRNVSSSGNFGTFEGDRVPNRPWLFASFGARGRIPHLPGRVDGILEPFYIGRYVHSFLRGWESVGLSSFKYTIPSQLSHDLGVTYSLRAGLVRLGATFEVDNVADARLYDSFGAQRPGRAFYAKLTGDL